MGLFRFKKNKNSKNDSEYTNIEAANMPNPAELRNQKDGIIIGKHHVTADVAHIMCTVIYIPTEYVICTIDFTDMPSQYRILKIPKNITSADELINYLSVQELCFRYAYISDIKTKNKIDNYLKNRNNNQLSKSVQIQCNSDKHDFFTSEIYTGGKIYKCRKCGLTIDSPNFSNNIDINYSGSYIDNTSDKWIPEDMNANQIKSFSLSHGDCPVLHINYKNGILKVQNKINPRDGGNTFPPNFFDELIISLSEDENAKILNCLASTDFSSFTTKPDVYRLMGCPGFTVGDVFSCEFSNGRKFVSYSPDYDEFIKLVKVLDVIIDENKYKMNNTLTDDTIWICKNCGVINKMKYDICYNCGFLRNF